MLGMYLNLAKTASFQVLFNSLIINHPTIWYYTYDTGSTVI
jgi:hypothetical protein